MDNGNWVRPVATDTDHGQLFARHYLLDDGSEPEILDVIRLNLTRRVPDRFQPENWEIGADRWRLRSSLRREVLSRVRRVTEIHPEPPLGSAESEFPLRQLEEGYASLALVSPTSNIECYLRRNFRGDPQVRLLFDLAGQPQDLPLTDPAWAARAKRLLSRLEDADHSINAIGVPEKAEVLLTLSLSEPLHGFCYKLVAGLVVLPSGRR